MPDICMCMSKNCARREECYRAQAIPDRLQSYSNFEELCNEGNFKYFWEFKKRNDNTDKE